MFAAASMASAFRFGAKGKGFLPMTQVFRIANVIFKGSEWLIRKDGELRIINLHLWISLFQTILANMEQGHLFQSTHKTAP